MVKRLVWKTLVVISLLGIGPISLTNPLFSHQDIFSDNLFSAGDWTPPQTTLVISENNRQVNEKVKNGSFEEGMTGWQTEGEVTRITGDEYQTPFDGDYLVRIGHLEDEGDEIWENKLRQVIENEAKNLSFYYNFYSFDTLGWDEPGMLVKINDRQVFRLSPGEVNGGSPASSGWQPVSIDLRGIQDPLLEIVFYSGNTGDRNSQSWVYIDKVSTGEAVVSASTVFELVASDDASGVASTFYSFDGENWQEGNNFTGADLSTGENTVYFYSLDQAGNEEAINQRQVARDDLAPEAVDNLKVTSLSKNRLVLDWTAPAAVVYDLRYSKNEIKDEADFEKAIPVPNPPAPAWPGKAESFEVVGLESGTPYWLAIKAGDSVPNWSGLSNVVSATTLAFEEDPWVNPGEVVINELMWMGTERGSGDEYLELRNLTDQTITLAGWSLTKKKGDGTETLMYEIPSGATLPPFGFLLIAEYDQENSALNGEPDLVVGSGETNSPTFALIDDNLQIKLFDEEGVLMDTADNGQGKPAAGQHDSSENIYYSMERNKIPSKGTQAANWHTTLADSEEMRAYWDPGAVERGTPGGRNLSENTEVLEIVCVRDNCSPSFSEPLFTEIGFSPGKEVRKTIRVVNNDSEEANFALEAVDLSDPGRLGNVFQIKIKKRGEERSLYDGPLSGLSGVSLSLVGPRSYQDYDLTVSMLEEAGDEYQNKSLSFVLNLGFELLPPGEVAGVQTVKREVWPAFLAGAAALSTFSGFYLFKKYLS